MSIISFFKKIIDSSNDPVKNCDVYKNEGCAHVDGFLCNMQTCNILRDYKKSAETKP